MSWRVSPSWQPEPRTRLGDVLASSLIKKASPFPLDDPGVWAIYCIFVPRAFRGQGVRLLSSRTLVYHEL